MKLEEACRRFNQIAGIRFGDLFNPADMNTIIVNKGKTGQLLELSLGMKLSNNNLDFEDGELKTNKCDANGNPKETVFITQISSIIDELIERKSFEETHLYKKISNILYVPVCKEGRPEDWMFLQSIHVDIKEPRFIELIDLWRQDYYLICEGIKNDIDNRPDHFIHTVSGKHLQIRSKDSKPYHPIYSQIYNCEVSNKNYAFYFKKQFVYDIRKMSDF